MTQLVKFTKEKDVSIQQMESLILLLNPSFLDIFFLDNFLNLISFEFNKIVSDTLSN